MMAMPEGDTSRPLSVCFRAFTRQLPNRACYWYIVNLSNGTETSSVLGPCDKDKVRKMKKEVKRRRLESHKKMERQIFGQGVEEEEEDNSTPMLTPISEIRGISEWGCWTNFGSVTYYFGGSKSRKFHFWDMISGIGKRKSEGPRMISERSRAKAVILRGNAYVFGGIERNSAQPWGEMLELSKIDGGEWKAIKEPPVQISSDLVFALPSDDGKKIFIGSLCDDSLFVYRVLKDSWGIVDEQVFDAPFFTEPILVGNTIYWVGHELLWAYDLGKKLSICGPIHFSEAKKALNMVQERRMASRLPFLHLDGDIFCLVWRGVDYIHGHPRTVLVFYKMQVLKHTDGKGGWSLRIKTVATDYFLTDCLIDDLDGSLVNGEDGKLAGFG